MLTDIFDDAHAVIRVKEGREPFYEDKGSSGLMFDDTVICNTKARAIEVATNMAGRGNGYSCFVFKLTLVESLEYQPPKRVTWVPYGVQGR